MKNAQGLLEFINSSKTAFQAAYEIKERLDKSGYKELHECDEWNLEKNRCV